MPVKTSTLNKEYDFFSVLNNGVTIVAESISSSGNKFTINNYQIVNGCQTSHVLFNNKYLDGMDNTNIPLKLIGTNDENVKSKEKYFDREKRRSLVILILGILAGFLSGFLGISGGFILIPAFISLYMRNKKIIRKIKYCLILSSRADRLPNFSLVPVYM